MLANIQAALEKYNRTKAANAVDHPSIAALRNLSARKQNDLLEVCRCFTVNPPKEYQTAYEVCRAVMREVVPVGGEIGRNQELIFLGLRALHDAKLLTEENFNFIRQNPTFLIRCARSLSRLHELNALTRQHLNLMKRSPDIWQNDGDIFMLSRGHILTEENLRLMINLRGNGASVLLGLLAQLRSSLSQATLNFLNQVPHNNLENIEPIVYILNYAFIHTSENFNQLLNPVNAYLLTDNAANTVWERFRGGNYLTQEVFNQLIIAASQAAPMQAVQTYVMQLMEAAGRIFWDDGFLDGQPVHHAPPRLPVESGSVNAELVIHGAKVNNTHNTEVTVSVATSIKKLKARYPEIDHHAILREIREFITSQANHEQALVCFDFCERTPEKRTGPEITLSDALALVWSGIVDKNSARPLLSDEDIKFRKHSLFENLRKTQEENKFTDGTVSEACFVGTFNAIIGVLSDIHPDVKVITGKAGILPVATGRAQQLVLEALRSLSRDEIDGILCSWGHENPANGLTEASRFRNAMKEFVKKILREEFDTLMTTEEIAGIVDALEYLPCPAIDFDAEITNEEEIYSEEETYLAHLIRALQEQKDRLTSQEGTSSQLFFSPEDPAMNALNTLLSLLDPTETESRGEMLTDEMIELLSRIRPLNLTIQEVLQGTLFEEEEGTTRQFLEMLQRGSRAVVSLLNTSIRRELNQLRHEQGSGGR